jgi:hypothetical protein
LSALWDSQRQAFCLPKRRDNERLGRIEKGFLRADGNFETWVAWSWSQDGHRPRLGERERICVSFSVFWGLRSSIQLIEENVIFVVVCGVEYIVMYEICNAGSFLSVSTYIYIHLELFGISLCGSLTKEAMPFVPLS